MLRIIGLTGQTGAGKTTVSGVLAGSGLDVINCDELARQVVRAGEPCLKKLVAHFGEKILLPNKELNRGLLGSIVFNDSAELNVLNKTIFPFIKTELQARMKLLDNGNNKLVVLDAPTLFESGADKLCDEIISVVAPPMVRRKRIIARDRLSEAEADSRMASQQDDEFYTSRSQHIICNNGTEQELTGQAQQLAKSILDTQ